MTSWLLFACQYYLHLENAVSTIILFHITVFFCIKTIAQKYKITINGLELARHSTGNDSFCKPEGLGHVWFLSIYRRHPTTLLHELLPFGLQCWQLWPRCFLLCGTWGRAGRSVDCAMATSVFVLKCPWRKCWTQKSLQCDLKYKSALSRGTNPFNIKY